MNTVTETGNENEQSLVDMFIVDENETLSGINQWVAENLERVIPNTSKNGFGFASLPQVANSSIAKVGKRINEARVSGGFAKLGKNDILVGMLDASNEEVRANREELFLLGIALRRLAKKDGQDFGFVQNSESVIAYQQFARWLVNHKSNGFISQSTISLFLSGVNGYANGIAVDANGNPILPTGEIHTNGTAPNEAPTENDETEK